MIVEIPRLPMNHHILNKHRDHTAMATRPITNLENYLNTRYNSAHDLLETDARAAERILLQLLNEPRLPLWKRAQCNMILACISEGGGARYLEDARHVLALFKDSLSQEPEPPLQAKISAMEEKFNEIEQDIVHREEHLWDAAEAAEEGVQPEAQVVSSGSQGKQGEFDDDEMLLGYEGDPFENVLTVGLDEMRVSEHTRPAPPRTPSPARGMEVDSDEALSTPGLSIFSPESQMMDVSDFETTVHGASDDDDDNPTPRKTSKV